MTRRVKILQRETIFSSFIFQIEELELCHEKFDGAMGSPVKRLVLDRGDAAAILLHDQDNEIVLLCEQFRAPTIKYGSGWLVELPAGMIDEGETAEACVRRETWEETGQVVESLNRIATVYPSPGGSSERIHIFYGNVSLRQDLPDTAGIASEGEDIRIILTPVKEAFACLRAGEIKDAKTMIALQWLEFQVLLDEGSRTFGR